ncbi:MAG TPA: ATP-binding protein [Methanomassiliicoccaceae archaeon]|nr:ATP-binding protein [Methanomassiliicoccaceae archaeon]
MVEKAFHNLLDNSLRHGGVTAIKVSVEEGPQGLSIVYTDDGKGIPRERKDEIFELAQNHRGLYLTKEALALTGIRITERGEMGKGARFDIIVPRGNYRRRGGMERLVMNRPRPDPQV